MSKFTIDVLDPRCQRDLELWEATVDAAALPDVYYRPGYVLACGNADERDARALLINADGFRVLLPLLVAHLHSASGTKLNAPAYAYSPYGYGGLLSQTPSHRPTPGQIDALRDALQQWGRENGIVCVVVRLHPMMGQHLWFEGYDGEGAILKKGNETIALDLDRWHDAEQRIDSLTAERRRNLINARRDLCVSWTCGWSEQACRSLQVFQSLYDHRMRSLGAGQFYFFPEQYYEALGKGLDRRLGIGLALRGDQPVAGALFMADGCYAHYHLSASDDVGRKLNATTLLINAGALWARERGCKKLHLGGGVSGDDSLFRFKQTFGGNSLNYATLTVISDSASFASLCAIPDASWPFSMHRTTKFHPVTA